MNEDEAALLAELRAISNRSAASNRFDEPELDTNNDSNDTPVSDTVVRSASEHSFEANFPAASPTPRNNNNNIDEETDASFQDLSFHTAAEGDLSLLSPTQTPLSSQGPPPSEKKPLPPWKRRRNEKRSPSGAGGGLAVGGRVMDDVVVVASPKKAAPSVVAEKTPPHDSRSRNHNIATGFQKDTAQPKTFNGNRGGSAEDEDLLRELMAISNRSASANRFAKDGDDDEEAKSTSPVATNDNVVIMTTTPKKKQQQPQEEKSMEEAATPKASTRKKKSDVPPWKRKNHPAARRNVEVDSKQEDDNFLVVSSSSSKKQQDQVENTPRLAAVATDEDHKTRPAQPNTKSSFHSGFHKETQQPKTFQGSRGGAAEDEDLLRELMAISNRSSSASRFAGGHDDGAKAATASEERKTDSDGGFVAPPPSVSAEQRPTQENSTPTEDSDVILVAGSSKSSKKEKDPSSALPPWKRRKSKSRSSLPKENDDVVMMKAKKPMENDTVVIADKPSSMETNGVAAHSSSTSPIKSGFQNNQDMPKTFKGNRGGAAEDEELLRELMAISNKSSSADRFAIDDGDDYSNDMGQPSSEATPSPPLVPKEEKKKEPPSPSSSLPPWKRKSALKSKPKESTEDDFVVVSSKTASPQKKQVEVAEEPIPLSQGTDVKFQQDSSFPKTFKGDRGGAAEDEELLKELMAISSRSVSNNRFAADDNDDINTQEQTDIVVEVKTPAPKAKDVSVPPWKRKGAKKTTKPASSDGLDDDMVLVTNNNKNEPPPAAPPVSDSPRPAEGFQKDGSMPNTFKGDRGGAAEDEDLLRELMAISSRSSSNNRFANTDDGETDNKNQVVVEAKPSAPKKKAASLPPWKRKSSKKAVKAAPNDATDDDVVGGMTGQRPPEPSNRGEVEESMSTGGFQKDTSMPNTFKGDRGGAAEDEDLLRELMAISNKSSSRFAADEGESSDIAPPREEPLLTKPSRSEPVVVQSRGADVPPWKQKKKKAVAKLTENSALEITSKQTQQEEEAPETLKPSNEDSQRGFQKSSDLPNTFKGDRGGSAEDEELLKLLLAVSSKSTGGNRFAEDSTDTTDEQHDDPPPKPHPAPAPAPTRAPKRVLEEKPMPVQPKPMAAPTPFPMNGGDDDEEEPLTIEDLPDAVKDKNWKVRRKAFALLLEILSARSDEAGNVEGDSILHGLDDLVPSMVADKNASALDSALQVSVAYADTCRGAKDASQAERIVKSLLKGSGFAGSRPSTVKLCAALTRKLMEVGESGASIQSVVTLLLEKGAASRKPKEVIATTNVILDATLDFGAALLPLSTIKAKIPKMLSHSNPTVRENGIKILAELCRALGSKGPVQDVVDAMKKAQQSQLDSLIEAQPNPTPPRLGLRSAKQSESATVPAGNALEALEAQTKAMEAEKFAKRPAVNILVELAKTDYSTRIQESKWSEKVGALDTVLQTGGAKPYKLVQPSSSVNYGGFVGEMKKLFSHSHYLVTTRAMQVLSMLAEGVGEKMFPHFRPLLTPILAYAKDKKLTKAVAQCLDAFFGNVLSLDHVLDKNDALVAVANEKKQKNVLVRASAMEFLRRCVERGETAGRRGAVNATNGQKAVDFCVEKLGDSDAGIRKSSTEVLRCIMAHPDNGVSAVGRRAVAELKSTHPRVFKSLQSSSKPSEGSPSKKTTKASSTVSSTRTPVKTGKATQAKVNRTETTKKVVKTSKLSSTEKGTSMDEPEMSEEEAIDEIEKLNIPLWSEDEDDGGVLAGINSANWQSRHQAILGITRFCDAGFDDKDLPTVAVLSFVKAKTKKFKESNFNILKAVMELFLVTCKIHASKKLGFPKWAANDGVSLCVPKLSDRKLSSLSVELMTQLCVVEEPAWIVFSALQKLQSVKSPVVHEAFMKWFKGVCDDFGANVFASRLNEIIPLLTNDCGSTNIKVRNASTSAMGGMHCQLGLPFRGLVLSMAGSLREQLESCFEKFPFDESEGKAERKYKSIFLEKSNDENEEGGPGSALKIEIPKADPLEDLGPELIEKLGSKEGKTAWKIRKEALDSIDDYLKKGSGLLLTAPPQLRFLVDLLRGLKERLSDSQSNLKPLAARCIGSILNSVDNTAQSKLGRVVYTALFGTAINDNRKPMREASLVALTDGSTSSKLEGGEINTSSVEPLVTSFVAAVETSGAKAVGLNEVLAFVTDLSTFVPCLEEITIARGQSLGQKFAAAMIDCMTSSKSDVRSGTESLLKAFVESKSIRQETLLKAVSRLKPAQQRTVRPVIVALGGEEMIQPKKENLEAGGPSKSLKTSRNTGGSGVSRQNSRSQLPPQTRQSSRSTLKPSSTRTQSSKLQKMSSSSSIRESQPALSISDHSEILLSGFTDKEQRLVLRLSWPEFPEAPDGSHLSALRKLWSPFLSKAVVGLLFPKQGIKKQDDVSAGYGALITAIEQEGEDDRRLFEQLSLVWRWIAAALCSREVTSGLQILLDLIERLVDYLASLSYKFAEKECMILLPYLVEQESIAKGRFKERFRSVLSSIQMKGLVSSKMMGSVVCVLVLERASQPKARVHAMRLCSVSVDECGLSGIGKKGVLLTGKVLSEETLPELRTASLDLLEVVLGKMNGDVERLAKVCGNSHLSDKAKALLEERWSRRNPSISSQSPPLSGSGRGENMRRSLLPPQSSRRSASTEELHRSHGEQALKLNFRVGETADRSAKSPTTSQTSSSGPFTFSFEADDKSSPQKTEVAVPSTNTAESPRGDTKGTTASLRARLMKIREMQEDSSNPRLSGSGIEKPAVVLEKSRRSTGGSGRGSGIDRLVSLLESLFGIPPPVSEDDDLLLECVDELKALHYAVTENDGSNLRAEITARASLVVERLSGVIDFAFNCGDESKDAGISVSILSVTLATLMALFRDGDLSQEVSQEALEVLIYEAGRGLLDPRLAVSSKYASSLDESTSSHMVRAINKLAVQAATGTNRLDSLLALLALQQRLTLEETTSPSGTAFNSRLSRIVVKLLAKVLKAEEALPEPFLEVDVEVLLKALETFMVSTRAEIDISHADFRKTCKKMATSLIEAFLRAFGRPKLRLSLEELGITMDSEVGEILHAISYDEEDESVHKAVAMDRPRTPSPTSDVGSSMDVGTLVARLAGASTERERQMAVDDLRAYRTQHGEAELTEHLAQVSTTFRDFVLRTLDGGGRETKSRRSPSGSDRIQKSPMVKSSSGRSLAMADRLRALRSKLDATEAPVQRSPSPRSRSTASIGSPQRERIVAPSTPVSEKHTIGSSHIQTPTSRPQLQHSSSSGSLQQDALTISPGLSSLRARLAEAQSLRSTRVGTTTTPQRRTGGAASLRARLEAVRKAQQDQL